VIHNAALCRLSPSPSILHSLVTPPPAAADDKRRDKGGFAHSQIFYTS